MCWGSREDLGKFAVFCLGKTYPYPYQIVSARRAASAWAGSDKPEDLKHEISLGVPVCIIRYSKIGTPNKELGNVIAEALEERYDRRQKNITFVFSEVDFYEVRERIGELEGQVIELSNVMWSKKVMFKSSESSESSESSKPDGSSDSLI